MSLAKQVVEFVAEGLGNVQAAMAAIQAGLDKTENATRALTTAMFFGGAQAMDALIERSVRLNARMRELERPGKIGLAIDSFAEQLEASTVKIEALQRLAAQRVTGPAAAGGRGGSGSGIDQIVAQTTQLNAQIRELERPIKVGLQLDAMRDSAEAVRVKLEAMKKAVASGEYAKNAADVARMTEEMKRLQKAADWQVLVQQKGQFGAWASYVGEQIRGVAGQLNGALQSALTRTQQQIMATPAAIGMAVAGFQLLVQSARSWVNAGISGTLYGNQLQLQFTLLSQQIASVFVPTLRLVIDALRQVTQWFRQLTGDQQATIRHWVEAAAAALAVFKAMGWVKSAVVSVAGSLLGVLAPAFTALVGIVTTGSLTMATAIDLATAGITAIIGLIVAAVTAAATIGAGIVVGTASGRSALESLAEKFRPIILAFREVYAAAAATLGPVLELLGNSIGSAISEAVEAVRDFVANLGGIGEAFKLAAAVVVGAMVAIAVATAPAWLPLLAIVAALTATLAALGAVVALLAAPFVALGGIVALVIYGLWDNLKKLFEPLLAIGRALWGSLVAVGRAVMAVVSAVGGALASVFSSFGTSLDDVFDKLASFAQWLADTIPTATNVMIHALADLLDSLSGFAGAIDAALGTNLQERMGALAAQLRTINVQVGGATPRTGQNRNDVMPAGGQFEDATALFRRMTEASMKSAAEERRDRIQEQQLAAQQQIAQNTTPRPNNPIINPNPGGGVAAPAATAGSAARGAGTGILAGVRSLLPF